MRARKKNKIRRRIQRAVLYVVLSFVPLSASATEYIGPEEVLSLSWGPADDQFGRQAASGSGPGGEGLSQEINLIRVLEDGTIVLSDLRNKKLKYFRDGVLRETALLDRTLFERQQEQNREKCREVKWDPLPSFGGRTTIACGENTYVIPRRFSEYVRDAKGNLYGVSRGHLAVTRFDPSGAMAGSLSVSESRYEGRQDSFLGGPVLAANGDAYFWRATAARFSILRWTWRGPQDLHGRPDTPRYVEAHPTQNGIAVRWWFPFQGREAITAFEIVRSERSGTPPYTPVGTVLRKDITGFTFFEDRTARKGITYYYRMRTVSGDQYSVYSNEAAARW